MNTRVLLKLLLQLLVANAQRGNRQLGRYGQTGFCRYAGENKPEGSTWMIDNCIQESLQNFQITFIWMFYRTSKAKCVKIGGAFVIENEDLCPEDMTTTTSELRD